MSIEFDVKVINVNSNKLVFHFINIGDYSEDFKSLVDSYIVSIYNSTYDADEILDVKNLIKKWFEGKKSDENKKAGYVAEFICHLYINQLNYEQHFLFENLEELGSMKKGFDGLYQKDDEMWLYESKSSLSTTLSANHNSNIGEAYRDIRDKVKGKKTNNMGDPITPWANAVHHANNAQVDDSKTLIDNLKELRKRFNRKDFENIENFNVIPSSTIFLEDRWKTIDNDDLVKKLTKLTVKYKYKNMNILCINKKSINSFIRYINEV